ncbi:cupin domain-containing protein [Maribacter hydrothermalis]|uniref:Cupin type-2 domain-containing protein n=1 Tax=Maribacter hydrothermalis TaxID=1836467 RepID=A0A1B7ZFC3_9FLAO|nr:cupin domain-containing protein [Maribacter hydrothermalis]APQ17776.1 hypothetical protein BTR34_10740 [Maribacter hydrothermalis]OBR42250.1 hypothetical protein A9200_02360 [Maribacter hydrothermalis]
MEVLNKPELMHLQIGDSMKILQVAGSAGMRIPHHYCSHEAVIVVNEGLAVLTMPDSEQLLGAGDSFVIPAKKEHTLKIKKDFKALAIMAVDSEINFI